MMKTSEFLKIMKRDDKSLLMFLKEGKRYIQVIDDNKVKTVGYISEKEEGVYFVKSKGVLVEEEIKAISYYTCTPIEERKDEEKYVVVVGEDTDDGSLNCYKLHQRNFVVCTIPKPIVGIPDNFVLTQQETSELYGYINNDRLRNLAKVGTMTVGEFMKEFGDED